MPFCLKLTKIWHYIRTCTKMWMAICFRKTAVYRNGLHISVCNSRNIVSFFFMFGATLKATNSSFQKGMTFCRSIYVKKVMELLAFIFEQPSYTCNSDFALEYSNHRTLICTNEHFFLDWCSKLGMVHCIMQEVTGYNLYINWSFVFLWRPF